MQEALTVECKRGTVAEHLDRVVDAGEPVLGGHPRGPLLDGFGLQFDGGAAGSAHQVMVVACRAVSIAGLTRSVPQRVDLSALAQCLQIPVDGGQADRFAAPLELVVQFLRDRKSSEAARASAIAARWRVERTPVTGPDLVSSGALTRGSERSWSARSHRREVMRFGCVDEGVGDDVGDVIVDEFVHDLAAVAPARTTPASLRTRRCWLTRGWLESSSPTSSCTHLNPVRRDSTIPIRVGVPERAAVHSPPRVRAGRRVCRSAHRLSFRAARAGLRPV